MKYRKLGNSSIEVSEMSIGCWTMGRLNWVEGQVACVIPGFRNERQMASNLAVVKRELSNAEMAFIKGLLSMPE